MAKVKFWRYVVQSHFLGHYVKTVGVILKVTSTMIVTYLPVRECDSSSKILPERKMNLILPSACCPVNYLLFEHFIDNDNN